MSTPVGQSDAHPLHDRHRSSARCTSGARHPRTSLPFTSSWSTRARPRVESFSSRVARYDGHITPPVPRLSARHLPTPVQRWTASEKSPSSCRYASASERRSGGAACTRRSASSGRGRTTMPGFSTSSGSSTPFTRAMTSRAAGEYMCGSSSPRARPSPCSPDSEPPYPATRRAASVMNARNACAPSARPNGKSSRTWMQPSPKCPYGMPWRPCCTSSASKSRR